MENPKIQVVEVKATSIGQECPVCNGFGTLRYGSKTCQACEGKGYILVPAEVVKKQEEARND